MYCWSQIELFVGFVPIALRVCSGHLSRNRRRSDGTRRQSPTFDTSSTVCFAALSIEKNVVEFEGHPLLERNFLIKFNTRTCPSVVRSVGRSFGWGIELNLILPWPPCEAVMWWCLHRCSKREREHPRDSHRQWWQPRSGQQPSSRNCEAPTICVVADAVCHVEVLDLTNILAMLYLHFWRF